MKTKNDACPGLPELMQALNFNDADLKANRAGYLTKRQRRWIRLTNAGYTAIAGCFIGIMSLWYLDGRPGLSSVLMNACFTSVYGLVFLGLIGIVFWFQANMRRDLKNPPVVYRVVVHKPENFVQKYLSLRFADKEVQVSRQVYEAFQDGAEYEIYYTRGSSRLLAAVPLKPNASEKGK